MIQEIQEILLDSCYYKENFKTVKQNDSSTRFLRFQLSVAGQPLNLTDTQVRFYCKKPDGTSVFSDMEIIDAAKGTAQVELTTQMLAAAGELSAEVRIYATGGKLLSTLPFSLTVAEAVCDDNALESTNEFSALTSALVKVGDFSQITETAIAAADSANDAARRAEQVANGAVADGAVTSFKMSQAKINVLDPSTVINAFLNQDGTITPNSDYICTQFIPCNGGEKYACPAGNRRRGAFYDSSKKLIKHELYSTWNDYGVIQAPANSKFFRLCYGASPYDGVAGWNVNNSMICFGDTYFSEYVPYGTVVPWLHTPIPDKSIAAQKVQDIRVNVLNIQQCTNGRLTSSGSVAEDSTCFVSDWITVYAGEVYTLPNCEKRYVCYYDVTKKLLSYIDAAAQGMRSITVPGSSGAKSYLRVSFDKVSFDVWNPMVCKDSYYYSGFVPYGTAVPWLEKNPLQGKKLAVLGDSICALHKSYITAVGYQNNMDFDRQTHNQSVWGSPVARHNAANEPASYLERFSLLRDTTDYLVIHGGVNDARMNIPLGTLTAWDDFTGNLNEYTFTGALESLFRKAQKKYPAAKTVFVLNHKLLHLPSMESYMDAALRACGKYSIPVLDLYHSGVLNIGIPEMKAKYWSDDIHLNEWGHLALVPVAENFLKGLTTSPSFGDPENAVKRLAYEKNSADMRFSPSILDSIQGVLPLSLSDIADNTPLMGVRIYGSTTETLASGTKGPNNKSAFQDISQTINLTCGEQVRTITLPQPLYRINNDICDTFTHTGTMTNTIKKLVLKGTETWVHYKNNGNYVCFYIRDSNLKAQTNSGTGLCNIADWKSWASSSTTGSGVCTTTTDNIIFFNLLGTDIGNNPAKSAQEQLDSFKAWLAAQYANGTPVIVYYQLAVPVTTQITGFSLPQTSYPVTSLTSGNDVKPRVGVDYYRSPKGYIDSKFSQLSAAIISLGGKINV